MIDNLKLVNKNLHPSALLAARRMSFLWEHSSAYRSIVRATASSKPLMAVFVFVTMVVLPVGAATVAQRATNPADDAAREALIRKRQTIDSAIVSKSNANKLNSLLADVRDGVNGEQRWREALGVERKKDESLRKR